MHAGGDPKWIENRSICAKLVWSRGVTVLGDAPTFDLQRKGGLPIYLQVKRKIEAFISGGQWGKGQRLPTERALAAELGVSRNTVSLAYRQLEAEGLITSRQGRGTFVAEADDLLRLVNKRERLNRGSMRPEDALSLGANLTSS